jgi:tetratricopeptide (TPR) repeat protein
VRRRLLTMSFLVFLLLPSLAAPKGLQEHRVEITPEQERYVLDDKNAPVFSISANSNCVICIEVMNDKQLFFMTRLRSEKNFFSSFLGSGDAEGIDIETDGEGNAQYTLPIEVLRNLTSGPVKLYYRAFVIEPETSNRKKKQFNILASSLRDEDWQKAPYLEVFSSAEEEEEANILEEAKVPYQKGQELYKQKKYEAAIEEFLKAKELANRGNIEYWLSYSYLQLAREYAQRALEHPTSSENAKREVKKIIDLLEQVLD